MFARIFFRFAKDTIDEFSTHGFLIVAWFLAFNFLVSTEEKLKTYTASPNGTCSMHTRTHTATPAVLSVLFLSHSHTYVALES